MTRTETIGDATLHLDKWKRTAFEALCNASTDWILQGLYQQHWSRAKTATEKQVDALLLFWALYSERKIGLRLFPAARWALPDRERAKNEETLQTALAEIGDVAISNEMHGLDGLLTLHPQKCIWMRRLIPEDETHTEADDFTITRELGWQSIPIEVGTTLIEKTMMQIQQYGGVCRLPYPIRCEDGAMQPHVFLFVRDPLWEGLFARLRARQLMR